MIWFLRVLLTSLFLFSNIATAAILSATAGSDRTSSNVDTSNATHGSIHCTWASLTGTLDGTFQAYVSNDGGATWVAKTGALITVSGASGSDLISLNTTVTELLYQVRWTKNLVTAGSVACNAAFKG